MSHSLSGAVLLVRDLSEGNILLITSAKLLLHVNCGALFFRLPLIQAARNFFGKEFSSDLVIFPMYPAVRFVINASMLGMLHRIPLTSLFFICFSLTSRQLIARILRIALW